MSIIPSAPTPKSVRVKQMFVAIAILVTGTLACFLCRIDYKEVKQDTSDGWGVLSEVPWTALSADNEGPILKLELCIVNAERLSYLKKYKAAQSAWDEAIERTIQIFGEKSVPTWLVRINKAAFESRWNKKEGAQSDLKMALASLPASERLNKIRWFTQKALLCPTNQNQYYRQLAEDHLWLTQKLLTAKQLNREELGWAFWSWIRVMKDSQRAIEAENILAKHMCNFSKQNSQELLAYTTLLIVSTNFEFDLGHLAEARRYLQIADRLAQGPHPPFLDTQLAEEHANLCLRGGDNIGAVNYLHHALATLHEPDDRYDKNECWYDLAKVAMQENDWKLRRDFLSNISLKTDSPWEQMRWLKEMIVVAIATSDKEGAKKYIARYIDASQECRSRQLYVGMTDLNFLLCTSIPSNEEARTSTFKMLATSRRNEEPEQFGGSAYTIIAVDDFIKIAEAAVRRI